MLAMADALRVTDERPQLHFGVDQLQALRMQYVGAVDLVMCHALSFEVARCDVVEQRRLQVRALCRGQQLLRKP